MELKLFSTRLLKSCRTGLKPPFALHLGPALLAKVKALLFKLEEMDDPYNVTLLPTLSQFCFLPDFSAMSNHVGGIQRMSVLVPLLEFLLKDIPEVLSMYEVSTQVIASTTVIYIKAHLHDFENLLPDLQRKVLILFLHSLSSLQRNSIGSTKSQSKVLNRAHRSYQHVLCFLLSKAHTNSHSRASFSVRSSWEPPLWLVSQIGKFLAAPLLEPSNSKKLFQSANFLGASMARYFVQVTHVYSVMKETFPAIGDMPLRAIQPDPIKVNREGTWVGLIQWGSLPNRKLITQLGVSSWLAETLLKIQTEHPLYYFFWTINIMAHEDKITGEDEWENVLPNYMGSPWKMILKNILSMEGDASVYVVSTILDFLLKPPIDFSTDIKVIKILAMLVLQVADEFDHIKNVRLQSASLAKFLYESKPTISQARGFNA
ncbi:hypothetical protein CROQUDRAFT_99931 [Cronartium quercuum f. sp. fusiforme G11]|uniref:Uncharacterized protein n=1 Tax=Cronartium quercuum f. sp. fusiforme G11 TaxID=708437 RepID=A0A9P6N783_9BASI|nr:hypothetical protein CROQUDRAFT_99931 [Cronartium quercuum f. sp. fusiforme G11]